MSTSTPMSTRAVSKAYLNHILENVLLQSADSPLVKALEQQDYHRPHDILSMNHNDIDAMEYVAEVEEGKEPVKKPLPRPYKAMLRAFQAYHHHMHSTESFTSFSNSFDEFRITDYNPNEPTVPHPSSLSSNLTLKTLNVNDFKRGICHDKTHYSVLKDDKQWDSWRCSTIATARSHACEEVFDPSYKPKTAEEKALFDEKQKFIYSVLKRSSRLTWTSTLLG